MAELLSLVFVFYAVVAFIVLVPTVIIILIVCYLIEKNSNGEKTPFTNIFDFVDTGKWNKKEKNIVEVDQ